MVDTNINGENSEVPNINLNREKLQRGHLVFMPPFLFFCKISNIFEQKV
jgi:hypothetical protein